jgi:catechol 2,3-dioxygenase-like lactoylglutathione lyase family enzyme
MPDRPTSDPKQFIQCAPVLHVADVKATAAYYRDILGFKWDFGNEEYSVVWRDNSAIHLARGGQYPPAGIHLFQWVRDVDAYYREIRDRGAEVLDEPTDRPYHIREFTARDPNGINIVFGQDIT